MCRETVKDEKAKLETVNQEVQATKVKIETLRGQLTEAVNRLDEMTKKEDAIVKKTELGRKLLVGLTAQYANIAAKKEEIEARQKNLIGDSLEIAAKATFAVQHSSKTRLVLNQRDAKVLKRGCAHVKICEGHKCKLLYIS